MKNAMDCLIHRRSIRKYKPEQISREELDAVIKAGTYAPSAMNRQSALIIAVQNKEDIALLSRLNAQIGGFTTDPFYGAPTVLVVLADANNANALADGSLVMGNLMNAAYAMGLGSCWINRTRELFAIPEGQELLKKWGIAGSYLGVACCILGYPAEEPEAKPRKENYVYYVL